MSDIVKRLRDVAGFIEKEHGRVAAAACLATEAAEEIERLRAWNEEIALNAREFAEALREAYEVYANSDGFIPKTASEGYQQQVIKQMVNCISAALEGK